MYCYVPGCPNALMSSKEEKKPKPIVQIFFTAPGDDNLFKQWQAAIPRGDHTFSRNDKICECHFQKSEVVLFSETKLPNGNVRRVPASEPKLKPGTVPSVFPIVTAPTLPSRVKNTQNEKSKLKRKASVEDTERSFESPVKIERRGRPRKYFQGDSDKKTIENNKKLARVEPLKNEEEPEVPESDVEKEKEFTVESDSSHEMSSSMMPCSIRLVPIGALLDSSKQVLSPQPPKRKAVATKGTGGPIKRQKQIPSYRHSTLHQHAVPSPGKIKKMQELEDPLDKEMKEIMKGPSTQDRIILNSDDDDDDDASHSFEVETTRVPSVEDVSTIVSDKACLDDDIFDTASIKSDPYVDEVDVDDKDDLRDLVSCIENSAGIVSPQPMRIQSNKASISKENQIREDIQKLKDALTSDDEREAVHEKENSKNDAEGKKDKLVDDGQPDKEKTMDDSELEKEKAQNDAQQGKEKSIAVAEPEKENSKDDAGSKQGEPKDDSETQVEKSKDTEANLIDATAAGREGPTVHADSKNDKPKDGDKLEVVESNDCIRLEKENPIVQAESEEELAKDHKEPETDKPNDQSKPETEKPNDQAKPETDKPNDQTETDKPNDQAIPETEKPKDQAEPETKKHNDQAKPETERPNEQPKTDKSTDIASIEEGNVMKPTTSDKNESETGNQEETKSEEAIEKISIEEDKSDEKSMEEEVPLDKTIKEAKAVSTGEVVPNISDDDGSCEIDKDVDSSSNLVQPLIADVISLSDSISKEDSSKTTEIKPEIILGVVASPPRVVESDEDGPDSPGLDDDSGLKSTSKSKTYEISSDSEADPTWMPDADAIEVSDANDTDPGSIEDDNDQCKNKGGIEIRSIKQEPSARPASKLPDASNLMKATTVPQSVSAKVSPSVNIFTPETIQQILKQIKLPLTTPVTLKIAPLVKNAEGELTLGINQMLSSGPAPPLRKIAPKKVAQDLPAITNADGQVTPILNKAGLNRAAFRTYKTQISQERKQRCEGLLGLKMFEGLGKIKKSFDYSSFLSNVDDDVQFKRFCLIIKECLRVVKDTKNAKTNIGKLTLNITRVQGPIPEATPTSQQPQSTSAPAPTPRKTGNSENIDDPEVLECMTVDSSVENHYEIPPEEVS